ncbi:hypothetical protein ACGFI9_12135 [Micromonospora sp. NPDC048930]|uniref:hypothetical protein n=1 Tax=Micromonospora sp. NPDC048930 TaxID=3364261 RepID=UPI00371CBE85
MDIVRLRYIGADRVHVPKLGKVVEPDELVGVPKDFLGRYAWGADWQHEDGTPVEPATEQPADEQATPAEQQTATTTTTTSRKGKNDA